MATPGLAANDPFQPSAVYPPTAGGQANPAPPPDWHIPSLTLISLQVPQLAPGNTSWISSSVIDRPFIIRGVAIQCDVPKATVYARFGYARGKVIDLPTQQGGTNIIGPQSVTTSSGQGDGIAMTIAGILLAPLYVAVDIGQAFLWAQGEDIAGAIACNITVSFFCDFSPGS